MGLDPYGRQIVSVWLPGNQMADVRAMVLEAVKLFKSKFQGTDTIRIRSFDVNVSSKTYEAKGQRQPKDLYGITLHCREKGYFVSIVEPNPAKARYTQVYAKIWMRDESGSGYYQEVMHLIYKPDRNQLVELRYVPDCSQGTSN